LKFKKILLAVFFTASWGSIAIFPGQSYADGKWSATPPNVAADAAGWVKLIDDLQTSGMNYGAMAAAYHMVAFFPDIATKEVAYRAVVSVIDNGYPILVRDVFIPGDLEPSSEDTTDPDTYKFANSYYLYKAMLSREKDLNKWAEYYLSRVDKEGFPKYLYFSALQAYSKGDLKGAEDLLNKTLAKNLATQPLAFVAKVTRTLARVYFEEAQYDKSLDIYMNFLLKMNPIVPTDWLETAWNYFHLKRYEEALGMLYNLESKAASQQINLEKYNVRALIYRSQCSITHMDDLIDHFNLTFGPTLDGIKKGEPLDRFPLLKILDLPDNVDYNQILLALNNLQDEQKRVGELSKNEGALASYVYTSEIRLLSRKIRSYNTAALSRAASQLLILSEQMRFAKYDIERSKFNPDTVFKPISEETKHKAVSDNKEAHEYEIRWLQPGDYWLDERSKYKGILPNQCSE
jgi:tetratricopeptide (TPR) repeat protein